MKTVGTLIRYFRKQRGLSQGELARLSGTTQATLSRVELDRNFPEVMTLISIADVLNVSLDELVGRKKYCEGRAEN